MAASITEVPIAMVVLSLVLPLDVVVARAHSQGCRHLWLITTNDKLQAIRFHQRRGMRLVAVHRNAIAESRRLKPGIPEKGARRDPDPG